MYVNSLACIRVKIGEGQCFRIDSGVIQGCIVSPWLLNVVMKEVKMRIERRGMRLYENSREWRLPRLLYAVDFILCDELEELVEMCRRDWCVMFAQSGYDWSMRQNLNIWGVFWTNQVQMRQCRRKVESGSRVAGAIRFLVNGRRFAA